MELSKKNFETSNSLFLEALILVSCINLLGLATSSPVVRGNETDQQALHEFKAKITGDRLRIMESWNSSIHFCQWTGVTCNRDQRVTNLELQFSKLSGSLSPFIGNLTFLRKLNLSDNGFYNHIPQEIGRLTRLEILHLANNSFTGEIPWNVSACLKLKAIRIKSNQLTGEIPASLGLMSNLKVLELINNSLRGSIPSSLGNLSSLEVLLLTFNRLTGIIPEALGKLTNLLRFLVAENAISGIVPVSMFNLSTIRSFDIGGNKIQGTLQSDLTINMPNVEFFSIRGNQINGQIPVSISNASNLNTLQFDDNRFKGSVPGLAKLRKLNKLLLGVNHFGYGKEGDLNFLCTLVNKTELKYLDVQANNFGGEIPECISNLSTTLLVLTIMENEISGTIPYGIVNLVNLEYLGVARNRLSGIIPFHLGRLHKLNQFYASSNFLHGNIPHSIGNLTKLTVLDLGVNRLQGNIPSSLGNCQNMLLLDLSDNNLSGPIPHQVLGLQSLSIWLDLSSNRLTGELPVAVEKLENLGILWLSRNRLSGLLPHNLGSCVSLEYLHLQGNLFEGAIPTSMSSLRGLVELDVSDNNLSGEVPRFLVSFGALKYLNLSFNDFEGMIPSEGVFKNASDTFVEGNNKLCGGIPELHLSRCNSETSTDAYLTLKFTIVVVTLGATSVFACLVVLWLRKKKDHRRPIATPEEYSILQLSYQSILKATDGFSTKNLVGAGSFGSVYRGILEASGAVIAVKVLNLLKRGAPRSFLAECEALKNVRHRNLVKLLTAISGFDYQGNDFKALVYEFMVNGSLEDWLHPSVDVNGLKTMRNLNLFQRVNVAVDVAHALEYLHHCCETSIIHCDLKPSNILLDEEMVSHIGDFGLAKVLSADGLHNSAHHQSSSLGLRGTIGYAPPEYGMGSELSTTGDVYSYGIVLLEMFTGKRPTDERFKEGLSLHNFVKPCLPDRVIEITDPILLQTSDRGRTLANITPDEKSLGNDRRLRCLNSIFEIGLACSAESPSERIDMSVVVTRLCPVRDNLLRPILMSYPAQSTGI